jgi:hypothetical protein
MATDTVWPLFSVADDGVTVPHVTAPVLLHVRDPKLTV